jgi:hypothetical protein
MQNTSCRAHVPLWHAKAYLRYARECHSSYRVQARENHTSNIMQLFEKIQQVIEILFYVVRNCFNAESLDTRRSRRHDVTIVTVREAVGDGLQLSLSATDL